MANTFLCALLLVSTSSRAEGLWDGLWYRNAEKSRRSDHTYSITRLSSGMWRYTEGSSTYVFATDGKPYPEPLIPDFTVTAKLTGGGTVLDLVETAYGRETERSHNVLSTDGATLTGTYTRVYPDGREVTSSTRAIRVSGGPGLEGTW